MKRIYYNKSTKSFSDANPTPEQEGVINFLKGFVEEHPGEAKYLVELGMKWGSDNLLEGLNHDAEGDKTESKKVSKSSSAVAKMFSDKDEWVIEYYDKRFRVGSDYDRMIVEAKDHKEAREILEKKNPNYRFVTCYKRYKEPNKKFSEPSSEVAK